MHKITPFLWFDGKAEEATLFYVSIFRNSRVRSINRQGKDGPVFSTTFELDGQDFFALNGGPRFTFSPAISFFVNCETQAEVDELWGKLIGGWIGGALRLAQGQVRHVVADHSRDLGKLLSDKDPKKVHSVMTAMCQMKKIDITTCSRRTMGAA